MKLPIENSKIKKEGDFTIKAFFTDTEQKKINRIDVIRKVPFTFNDEQVEETAILRFKDNHKKGEAFTSETIFGHLHFNKTFYLNGYSTIQNTKWETPYKVKRNSTLKRIWENPTENRHIVEFMKLFNNFHLLIKKDCVIEFEHSSLRHYAHQIYEAYKKENENKKVLRIPNRPQQFYDGLIGDEDIFNKVFSGGIHDR